jgi:hypothetical protein
MDLVPSYFLVSRAPIEGSHGYFFGFVNVQYYKSAPIAEDMNADGIGVLILFI